MSRKYKFKNPTAAYFVSFATVYWLDVFTRQMYFSILEEAVTYCRAEKGMQVFAYCFMPSHVHFVFRSDKEDPSGLLRDFKGFTARKLIKEIEENPQESRKEWLLWMMERAGKKKSNVAKRQFWQQHNKPIELWSGKVIKQKIDYIHNNPVESGFVTDPIDWKYSSARNYADDDTSGNIQYIYDANGTKLKKTVSTTGTETLYAGGYIYEGNTLQFFPHPEGYVTPNTTGGYDYVYNYKDHVDNIRLSYTDANGDGDITTNEIIKESNYYPYGLSHKGYNNNVSSLGNSVAKRFMFGSKELDESLGLGTYDFGARNYEPALGRWMNIDPLADQMRRHSPYNYAFDNPIFFLDPDGMMPCPTGDCDSFFAGMVERAQQFNQSLVDRAERFVDNPVKSINKGLADTGGFLADVTNISGIMGEENQLYSGIAQTVENLPNMSNKELGSMALGGVLVVAEIAISKKTKSGAGSVASLSDDALVVRGGSNTAARFDGGSGVSSRISDQKLDGISVNSKIDATLEQLSQGIPHNKIGVTTVGDVRKAGGDVLSSPTKNNPNHATMSIPNSEIASSLMEILKNPNKQ